MAGEPVPVSDLGQFRDVFWRDRFIESCSELRDDSSGGVVSQSCGLFERQSVGQSIEDSGGEHVAGDTADRVKMEAHALF